MKKDYNFFVSRRNTPKLKLYTWLIGMFYGFTGFNSLLSALVCRECDKETVFGGWLLGIAMFSMVHVAVTDPTRENRNLGAVIVTGLVHFVITIFLIIDFQFVFLTVVYIVEWVICIACIIYFCHNKKKKKK